MVLSAVSRQAAFADPSTAPAPIRGLLAKVTEGAYRITDEDVAAVALPEDEIFELVVAAAMGKAARQLAAAHAAIAEVG